MVLNFDILFRFLGFTILDLAIIIIIIICEIMVIYICKYNIIIIISVMANRFDRIKGRIS